MSAKVKISYILMKPNSKFSGGNKKGSSVGIKNFHIIITKDVVGFHETLIKWVHLYVTYKIKN